MQLSRFKVARLLKQARASGLVRIELNYRGDLDIDLSVRLRTAYGSRYCTVIDSDTDDEVLLHANVGHAAARLLAEVLNADDVVGLLGSLTGGNANLTLATRRLPRRPAHPGASAFGHRV